MQNPSFFSFLLFDTAKIPSSPTTIHQKSMTDSDPTYWQNFQSSEIVSPPTNNLLLSQQQSSPPNHHQPQWNEESEKRKWSPDFQDFDINTHANKVFHMEEYQNNEPSENESQETASISNRRNHVSPDPMEFQGGDQKQRRKEQNRAAQRAFRERKERYVKELQVKIRDMEKKHNEEMTRVVDENKRLKDLVKKMEVEIYTLKGAAIAFDVSLSKLREAGLDVPSTKSIMRRDSPPPSILDRRSSPDRDYQSTSSSIITSSTEKRSTYDPLFDSIHRYSNNPTSSRQHRPNNSDTTDDDHTIEDDDEVVSFAESETRRFDHTIDPIVHSGHKMIPCSQIWERLSQHPNFDDFDVDRLCEELKKKARCSGSGPVIPEFELQEVLRRMDAKRS